MSTRVDDFEGLSPPAHRDHERLRGIWGMGLFIATEAMLFVLLFFAYFYLAASRPHWPLEQDPPYTKALIMLAILLLSSVVSHWGQKGIERGRSGRLKIGLGLTLVLAGAFLYVSYLEHQSHLKELAPTDNAYGSIFYTITSFHLAHLILGVLMLAFVLVRAFAGHFSETRHLAVKNTVTYWHFVDVVWIFVVAILYVSPHLYGPPYG